MTHFPRTLICGITLAVYGLASIAGQGLHGLPGAGHLPHGACCGHVFGPAGLAAADAGGTHAGHSHAGHSHAGHSHAGHSHDSHSHGSHSHTGHSHTGHSHTGHSHGGHAHVDLAGNQVATCPSLPQSPEENGQGHCAICKFLSLIQATTAMVVADGSLPLHGQAPVLFTPAPRDGVVLPYQARGPPLAA
jgi:hypothetical protein